MRYFVYRHIRLDNNQPFYIGIGTCKDFPTHRMNYRRAYTSCKRSQQWTLVAEKAGFSVDIVYNSDNQEEVKGEEIRLIALYGRRDQGKGSLVNHTDGGDGRLCPNKGSMVNVGKNLELYREAKKKKVYQYSLDGTFVREWSSLTSAFTSFGDKSTSGILQCCQNKIRQYKGYMWSYLECKDMILRDKKTATKKVARYDRATGELLQEYISLIEANRLTGVSFKCISLAALGKTKTAGGYKWKYI